MFAFRQMRTDAVSCSDNTCTVVATIRAGVQSRFRSNRRWRTDRVDPPGKRSLYLSGQTPPGEQTYRVQITYKHRGEEWRALEFDRAPVE